jgi:hypothetical protein
MYILTITMYILARIEQDLDLIKGETPPPSPLHVVVSEPTKEKHN